MFCGNIICQLLTGMEGGRESMGKVVIKSDWSQVDIGE